MKKGFFAFSLLAALLTAMSFSQSPSSLGIGDTAPDFKLKNVDDKKYALADLQDAQGYIVIFTCNHCPYAKAYEDRIIDLHSKYAPMGYPVVAINPNDKNVAPEDSFDKMKEYAARKSYPFLYLYDESQDVARAYGATRTPHVYLLDKNRKVQYIGAIDDNSEEPEAVNTRFVEEAVDALRAGKPVPTTETKAIGCTIKWKKS